MEPLVKVGIREVGGIADRGGAFGGNADGVGQAAASPGLAAETGALEVIAEHIQAVCVRFDLVARVASGENGHGVFGMSRRLAAWTL
jgi:hypothetical protein